MRQYLILFIIIMLQGTTALATGIELPEGPIRRIELDKTWKSVPLSQNSDCLWCKTFVSPTKNFTLSLYSARDNNVLESVLKEVPHVLTVTELQQLNVTLPTPLSASLRRGEPRTEKLYTVYYTEEPVKNIVKVMVAGPNGTRHCIDVEKPGMGKVRHWKKPHEESQICLFNHFSIGQAEVEHHMMAAKNLIIVDICLKQKFPCIETREDETGQFSISLLKDVNSDTSKIFKQILHNIRWFD